MKAVTHYTPKELFELHPEVQLMGWTPTKIGVMYSVGLLIGFRNGKSNQALITEESFIELMKFYNNTNSRRNFEID